MTQNRAGILGIAAVVVAVAPFQLLATNDGPRHLLSAAVHHDPGAFPCFEPAFPPSGAFVPELFAPFLAIASALTAAEIVGRLLPVAVALAAFAAASALGARRTGLVIAPLVALNQGLVLGFVPFETALATGFAAIAIVARARSVAVWGAAALLLWIAARFHIVAASGAGFLCAAIVVERFGWARGFGVAVALGVAPASVVFAVAAESGYQPVYGTVGSALAQLSDATRFLIPLPPWAGALLALPLVAGLLWELRRRPRPVFVVALCFLALSLAVPRDVFGWQYGGPRLLPFVALVAAVALPDRATLVASVTALAAAAAFATGAVQARVTLRPVLDDIARINAPPKVELDVNVGSFEAGFFGSNQPLFSTGQLIALRFGNMPLLGQHIASSMHNILELCSPPTFPRRTSLAPVALVDSSPGALATVTTWGTHADGIVLVVNDEAALPSIENGLDLATVERHGRLVLGRQRQCPLRVVVDDAVPGLDVNVGFDRAPEPARTYSTTSSGRLSMDEDLPCGSRRLEVEGAGGHCAEGARIPEHDGVLHCTWQLK